MIRALQSGMKKYFGMDSLNFSVLLMKTVISMLFVGLVYSAKVNAQESNQEQPIDNIIAIVNKGVVLGSELEDHLKLTIQQLNSNNIKLPPENILKKQVLERLIITRLQVQEAERRGIQVDDISLNQVLRQMAQQNSMSLENFRNKLLSENIDYIEFREELRRDIMVKRLRQGIVNSRVTISDQEVQDYIVNASNQNENTEYLISHIEVSIPEASGPDTIEKAQEKAEKIYARLLKGDRFSDVAIAESEGRNALDGGDLGWRKPNALPALFAKALNGLKVNEFSKPIRTPRGFHILLLRDTKGIDRHMVQQARARHILLETNTLRTDEQAREQLSALRNRIVSGEDFEALAKEYSDDTTSAEQGGDLGWAEPQVFVSQFSKVLDSLPVNAISEPFKTKYGWHIVKMLERRDYDKTTEYQEEQARRNIYKRKAVIEEELWIRRLRDDAYVEIRIDV